MEVAALSTMGVLGLSFMGVRSVRVYTRIAGTQAQIVLYMRCASEDRRPITRRAVITQAL